MASCERAAPRHFCVPLTVCHYSGRMTTADLRSDAPVSVRRIPDPAEPLPVVALPTLALLVGGIALWVTSSALFLAGALAWWLTIPRQRGRRVSALHRLPRRRPPFRLARALAQQPDGAAGDAALRPACRLPGVALHPHAAPPVHQSRRRLRSRRLHDGRPAPGSGPCGGCRSTTPTSRSTCRAWRAAPRRAASSPLARLAVFVVVYAAISRRATSIDLLVLLFVPSRLAVLYLAWAFDYLPHHGLHHRPSERPPAARPATASASSG